MQARATRLSGREAFQLTGWLLFTMPGVPAVDPRFSKCWDVTQMQEGGSLQASIGDALPIEAFIPHSCAGLEASGLPTA